MKQKSWTKLTTCLVVQLFLFSSVAPSFATPPVKTSTLRPRTAISRAADGGAVSFLKRLLGTSPRLPRKIEFVEGPIFAQHVSYHLPLQSQLKPGQEAITGIYNEGGGIEIFGRAPVFELSEVETLRGDYRLLKTGQLDEREHGLRYARAHRVEEFLAHSRQRLIEFLTQGQPFEQIAARVALELQPEGCLFCGTRGELTSLARTSDPEPIRYEQLRELPSLIERNSLSESIEGGHPVYVLDGLAISGESANVSLTELRNGQPQPAVEVPLEGDEIKKARVYQESMEEENRQRASLQKDVNPNATEAEKKAWEKEKKKIRKRAQEIRVRISKLGREVFGQATRRHFGGRAIYRNYLLEDYLGGQEELDRYFSLSWRIKRLQHFIHILRSPGEQRHLLEFSENLAKLIAGEEEAFEEKKAALSTFEDIEAYRNRIRQLKDIQWFVSKELLGGIQGLHYLSGMDLGTFRQLSDEALQLLRNVYSVLNAIDRRLETRGRDSLGTAVSVTFADQKAYQQFREKLHSEGLESDFEERQNIRDLGNGSISVQFGYKEGGEDDPTRPVTVTFVNKIAKLIGFLGENANAIRGYLREDKIFRAALTAPYSKAVVTGQSRWASVGGINEALAHPQDNKGLYRTGENGEKEMIWPLANGIAKKYGRNGNIFVVLNGDINNHGALKKRYSAETGARLSDPRAFGDTPVIPITIERYIAQGFELLEAFRRAVNDFEGTFTIQMQSDLEPGKIFIAQGGKGQSLYLGISEDGFHPASEIYGFVEETQDYIKLQPGQIVMYNRDLPPNPQSLKSTKFDGTPLPLTEEDLQHTTITSRDIDIGEYNRFLVKEIHDAPQMWEDTIAGKVYLEGQDEKPVVNVSQEEIPKRFIDDIRQRKMKKLVVVAMGTSDVAGAVVAQSLIERALEQAGHGDLKVIAEVATETSAFRIKGDMSDTGIIAVSQSGTSTDTNVLLYMARKQGAVLLGIINKRDSDATFIVDGVIYTGTGRDVEIAVPSTKAFYAQIAAGAIIALKIMKEFGVGDDIIQGYIQEMLAMPDRMRKVLNDVDSNPKHSLIEEAGYWPLRKPNWKIIGSGPNYLSAREIRIKISELTYRTVPVDFVENFKHIDFSAEPWALLVLANVKLGDQNERYQKDIISEMEKMLSHNIAVTAIISEEGQERIREFLRTAKVLYKSKTGKTLERSVGFIEVPKTSEPFAPVLTTLAGHLLSYYTALAMDKRAGHLVEVLNDVQTLRRQLNEEGVPDTKLTRENAWKLKVRGHRDKLARQIREGIWNTGVVTDELAYLTELMDLTSGTIKIKDAERRIGHAANPTEILDELEAHLLYMRERASRSIDTIPHQAKTLTVGSTRGEAVGEEEGPGDRTAGDGGRQQLILPEPSALGGGVQQEKRRRDELEHQVRAPDGGKDFFVAQNVSSRNEAARDGAGRTRPREWVEELIPERNGTPGIQFTRYRSGNPKAHKEFITEPVDERVLERRRQRGDVDFDVIHPDSELRQRPNGTWTGMTQDEFLEALRKGVQEPGGKTKPYDTLFGFVFHDYGKTDSRFWEAVPNLKRIILWSTGFNMVDIEEATRRGIRITFAPGPLTNAMKELTGGGAVTELFFELTRQFEERDRSGPTERNLLEAYRSAAESDKDETMAQILWGFLKQKSLKLPEMLRIYREGKFVKGAGVGPKSGLPHDQLTRDDELDIHTAIGIIGMDAVGKRLAQIAGAYHAETIYYYVPEAQRDFVLEESLGLTWAPLETVLEKADFLAATPSGAELGDFSRVQDKLVYPSRIFAKQGKEKEAAAIFENGNLTGKELAIVGFGRIGTVTAEIAVSLGLRIRAYDPIYKNEKMIERVNALGRKLFGDRYQDLYWATTIEELLGPADFTAVLVDLNKHTEGLFGRKELEYIKKPNHKFINTSRGGVLREKEVKEWLQDHPDASAFLDVLADESPTGDRSIAELPNVWLTSHMGSKVTNVRWKMADSGTDDFFALLDGRWPSNPLNFEKKDALDAFQAAVTAVKPSVVVPKHVQYDRKRRTLTISFGGKEVRYELERIPGGIYLVGMGRASGEMARELHKILGHEIVKGAVATVEEGTVGGNIRLIQGGHPVLNERSVAAADEIVKVVDEANEKNGLVIAVISGGGSALAANPADSISFADLQTLYQLMLSSKKMDIGRINTVRPVVEKMKGGNLRARAPNAYGFVTLTISDVPTSNDDPQIIASGPTVPTTTSFTKAERVLKEAELWNQLPPSILDHIEKGIRSKKTPFLRKENPILQKDQYVLLGTNRIALEAAKKALEAKGYRVMVEPEVVRGNVDEVAEKLIARARATEVADQPIALLSGGEPTVQLPAKKGEGGRNSHLVTLFARRALEEGVGHFKIASLGTDGIDGSSSSVGGILDPAFLQQRKALAAETLKEFDTAHLLALLNGQVNTGPTGTNVADIQMLLSRPKPEVVRAADGGRLTLAQINNEALRSWIEERAHFTGASEIEVVDESDDARLLKEEVEAGEMVALPDGNYYARSHPKDVARSEDRTYVATRNPDDKGLYNHWEHTDTLRPKVEKQIKDSMRGKKMYVIPYLMGPVGSPYSQAGVEITDSRYVAINMIRMTKVGEVALKALGTSDTFVKGVHSTGDLDALKRATKPGEEDDRYFVSFPEEREIWSFGSAYGGNALLGKKFHALRQAMYDARKEGWLAEHMLIVGIEDLQTGRTQYVAAAFPSASGKTNLAMMQPPAALKERYRVWLVGDDIAWLNIGQEGRLYAINPENGLFGVVPGTNHETNPNAMGAIGPGTKTIFTNVAYNAKTGELWWEGKTKQPPADLDDWLDWQGKPITARTAEERGKPWAHANSRFTAFARNVPNISPHWQDPEGVPISAILFGGRMSQGEPLIRQLRDGVNGIYDGLFMGVETTAAAEGQAGQFRPDPMAQRPFFSYHEGDYAQNWLSVIERLGDKAPSFFHVNWFRKGPDGRFLWPGYGENLRPILWALERARGRGEAIETPIGYLPTKNALNLEGLGISDAALNQLLFLDLPQWREEALRRTEYLKSTPPKESETLAERLPQEILRAHERFVAGLSAAGGGSRQEIRQLAEELLRIRAVQEGLEFLRDKPWRFSQIVRAGQEIERSLRKAWGLPEQNTSIQDLQTLRGKFGVTEGEILNRTLRDASLLRRLPLRDPALSEETVQKSRSYARRILGDLRQFASDKESLRPQWHAPRDEQGEVIVRQVYEDYGKAIWGEAWEKGEAGDTWNFEAIRPFLAAVRKRALDKLVEKSRSSGKTLVLMEAGTGNGALTDEAIRYFADIGFDDYRILVTDVNPMMDDIPGGWLASAYKRFGDLKSKQYNRRVEFYLTRTEDESGAFFKDAESLVAAMGGQKGDIVLLSHTIHLIGPFDRFVEGAYKALLPGGWIGAQSLNVLLPGHVGLKGDVPLLISDTEKRTQELAGEIVRDVSQSEFEAIRHLASEEAVRDAQEKQRTFLKARPRDYYTGILEKHGFVVDPAQDVLIQSIRVRSADWVEFLSAELTRDGISLWLRKRPEQQRVNRMAAEKLLFEELPKTGRGYLTEDGFMAASAVFMAQKPIAADGGIKPAPQERPAIERPVERFARDGGYRVGELELKARTIPELLALQAKRYGDRTEIMAPDPDPARGYYEISFKQFDEKTDRMMRALYAQGIRPGDRVAFLSTNRLEFVESMMGVWKLGGAVVPMSFRSPSAVLEHILSNSDATSLVVSAGPFLQTARALKANNPNIRKIFTLDPLPASALQKDEISLATWQERTAVDLPAVEIKPGDVALILYTSGSTKLPKGAPLTHQNILYNREASRLAWEGQFTEDDMTLGWLPFFHVMGTPFEFLGNLYVGARYAFPRLQPGPPTPDQLVTALNETGATVIHSVPWMLEGMMALAEGKIGVIMGLIADGKLPARALDLAKKPDPVVLETLRRLKFVHAGGVAIPREVGEYFHRQGINLIQGEGMSEVAGAIFLGDPSRRDWEAMRLIPGMNAEFDDVGFGVAEELVLVNSPTVIAEYLKNSEATAEVYREPGRFHTGDLFEEVAPGLYVHRGRIDDTYNLTTGEKINPLAMEKELEEDPAIHRAALVGKDRTHNIAIVQPNYNALRGMQQMEIEDVIHEAFERVNAGYPDYARVRPQNVIIMKPHEEPLPTTPKNSLIRPEIERRFADRIREVYTRQARVAAGLEKREARIEAVRLRTQGLRKIRLSAPKKGKPGIETTDHLGLTLAFIDERQRTRRVTLDGDHLTIGKAVAVGRDTEERPILAALSRSERVRGAMQASVDWLADHLAEGGRPYGVKTGFGGSADVQTDQTKLLQKLLILMQHAGFGPTLPDEVARGTMLVRGNSLAKGYSAIRPFIVDNLMRLLNERVTPVLYMTGSISSSGDLTPNSHVAAVLEAERDSKARYQGKVLSGKEALEAIGMEPVVLGPKEGLALINGTSASTFLAALNLDDANTSVLLAQALTALTTEVRLGTNQAFVDVVQEAKGHPGQVEVGANLFNLLEGGQLARDERDGKEQIGTGHLRQDTYDIRTAPQHLGPQVEDIVDALRRVTIELNSFNDNPQVDVAGDRLLHTGNFQATVITNAMDHTRLALMVIGKTLYVQLKALVDKNRNNGLPANLAGYDSNVFMGFKGVEIGSDSEAPMLQFFANPIAPHTQTNAELGNQGTNAGALLSGQLTRILIGYLQQLQARHLLAHTHSADQRNIELAYRATTQRIVGEIVEKLLPTVVDNHQEITPLAKAYLVWLAGEQLPWRYIDAVGYKPLIDTLRLGIGEILRGNPSILKGAKVQLKDSDVVARFSFEVGEAVIQELKRALPEAEEAALQEGAGHLLGRTRPLYEFVRRDLGVRYDKAERPPSAALQIILDAIQDGRIVEPLLETFFPTPTVEEWLAQASDGGIKPAPKEIPALERATDRFARDGGGITSFEELGREFTALGRAGVSYDQKNQLYLAREGKGILQNINLDDAGFQQEIDTHLVRPPEDEMYGRNIFYKDENVVASLITWPVGSGTHLHSHGLVKHDGTGGSVGIMRVLRGRIKVTAFYYDMPSNRFVKLYEKHLKAGDTLGDSYSLTGAPMGGGFHIVQNEGNEEAVTGELFLPPYEETFVFREEHGIPMTYQVYSHQQGLKWGPLMRVASLRGELGNVLWSNDGGDHVLETIRDLRAHPIRPSLQESGYRAVITAP